MSICGLTESWEVDKQKKKDNNATKNQKNS